jgi:FKBP-type peptidyl-prolyl cis-trans isomerase FklB
MKSTFVAMVLISGLFLGGCDEDPEKQAFRQQLIEKALNDDTHKAGVLFLAENEKREGVVVTSSGLQYQILHKSDQGERPDYLHSVVVNYEGTRTDGGVFDSSYSRGKPSIFPLQRVIKGWQEALLKMQTGDIWMLYVPADLAYGATSPSEAIPANSVLVFKVELLAITDNKGSK